MKLNKKQREQLYWQLLFELEAGDDPFVNIDLCHAINNLFRVWTYGKSMQENLPELAAQRPLRVYSGPENEGLDPEEKYWFKPGHMTPRKECVSLAIDLCH